MSDQALNPVKSPPVKSARELEVEARLKAAQAKKDARAEVDRIADLERAAKALERENEEEDYAAGLAERYGEIGIKVDFLRFGDSLVAFAHAKSAHDIFTKKLPEKGQVNPSEVRNFVHRSLVDVDGKTEPKERGDAFDAIAEEFPGAPAMIANVLLDMAKGQAAQRKGK